MPHFQKTASNASLTKKASASARKQQRRVAAGVLLGILLVIAGLSIRSSIHSDVVRNTAVSDFREALAKARDAEACRYAPQALSAAQKQWDTMLAMWQKENRKWGINRNTSAIRSMAEAGSLLAKCAVFAAEHAHDSLRIIASNKISMLAEKIDLIKARYNTIPMPRELRRTLVSSEMLLTESKGAYARGEFTTAATKVSRALLMGVSVGDKVASMVDSYLDNVPLWQRWVDETIALSRKRGDIALIVDKMAHVCRVYASGLLKTEIQVELGRNWMGHKRCKGDDATPEGKYFITRRKSGGATIYKYALEINYPNSDDRRTFALAKQSGRVPLGAAIGGLIEIHGMGGKGADWTNGCVALENSDMERLYRMVAVGTPLTIVGSLSTAKNSQQQ